MNKLTKTAICAAAAVAMFSAAAEPPACGKEGPGRKARDAEGFGQRSQERRMEGMRPNRAQGHWVLKLFSEDESLEKIGVTDKAAAEKIKKEFESLKEQSADLETKIRQSALEQAKMMRSVNNGDKSVAPATVLAKIDETWKLRAEQGKIAVKSILLLRDNLTAEQFKAAQSLIRCGARSRIENRRGEPFGGRRGGMRGREGAPGREGMRDRDGGAPGREGMRGRDGMRKREGKRNFKRGGNRPGGRPGDEPALDGGAPEGPAPEGAGDPPPPPDAVEEEDMK